MEDSYYTSEDVAEVLNCKLSTVRTYCKRGMIPAIKVGRGYRVSRKDLEKWMKSKKDYEPADIDDKADERYRILFESASDAIMICNQTGHINLANPQFSKLSGYSLNEVKDMHFSRLFHPDDLTEAVETYMKTMAGELNGKNLEIRLVSKDKKTLQVSVNTNALYERGELTGVQTIIRDFTDEKQAQDRTLVFTSMLDQAGDAFIGIDEKREITFVNRAAQTMFGYDSAEIIGQDIRILHGTSAAEDEKAAITEAVLKNGVWTGEILNKRRNGKRFWCWVTVNKIGDKKGNLIAYSAVIKEIDKKV